MHFTVSKFQLQRKERTFLSIQCSVLVKKRPMYPSSHSPFSTTGRLGPVAGAQVRDATLYGCQTTTPYCFSI